MKFFLLPAALVLVSCSDQSLPYEISGDQIMAPLTLQTTDIERGEHLFSNRGDAHCVLCHTHAKAPADFQGDLGPDLTRVGKRLSPAQIRLRIVDYETVKPGTTMPSYFRTHDLNQVQTDKLGQTVLSPLEIEDIIAFLVVNEN